MGILNPGEQDFYSYSQLDATLTTVFFGANAGDTGYWWATPLLRCRPCAAAHCCRCCARGSRPPSPARPSRTAAAIGSSPARLIFGLSMAARPIGALLFGHIGDTHGRSRALALGILAMALGTMAIGCGPGRRVSPRQRPLLLPAGGPATRCAALPPACTCAWLRG